MQNQKCKFIINPYIIQESSCTYMFVFFYLFFFFLAYSTGLLNWKSDREQQVALYDNVILFRISYRRLIIGSICWNGAKEICLANWSAISQSKLQTVIAMSLFDYHIKPFKDTKIRHYTIHAAIHRISWYKWLVRGRYTFVLL